MKGIKFNGTTIEIPQEYLKSVVVGNGTITFTDQSGNTIKFIQEKVEIDKELSVDSANPVENKAVATEINSVKKDTQELNSSLSLLQEQTDELEIRTASQDAVGGIRMWTDDTTLYISTSLYDNEVIDNSLVVSGAYTVTGTNSGIKIG